MKLAITADIHGSRDIFDKMKQLTKDECDVLIIAGDIYAKDYACSNRELAAYQEDDYNYMIEILDSLSEQGIICIYINGNDDYYSNEDDEYHLLYPRTIDGYHFIPFPYINITTWHTCNELDEEDLFDELESLSIKENTFIVGHMMPYGIADSVNFKHVGSKAYCNYLQNQDQILGVFGGHLHECGLEVGYAGSSMVFNCASEYQSGIFNYFLVDTDTLDYEEYSV